MKVVFLLFISVALPCHSAFAKCSSHDEQYEASESRPLSNTAPPSEIGLVYFTTDTGYVLFADQIAFVDAMRLWQRIYSRADLVDQFAEWLEPQIPSPPINLRESPLSKYKFVTLILVDLAEKNQLYVQSEESGSYVSNSVVDRFKCNGRGGRNLRTTEGKTILISFEWVS